MYTPYRNYLWNIPIPNYIFFLSFAIKIKTDECFSTSDLK